MKRLFIGGHAGCLISTTHGLIKAPQSAQSNSDVHLFWVCGKLLDLFALDLLVGSGITITCLNTLEWSKLKEKIF